MDKVCSIIFTVNMWWKLDVKLAQAYSSLAAEQKAGWREARGILVDQ